MYESQYNMLPYPLLFISELKYVFKVIQTLNVKCAEVRVYSTVSDNDKKKDLLSKQL